MKTSYFVLILVSFFLISCQPILKMVTGIRDPEVYVNDTDRIKYYQSWMENLDTEVTIYTISSEDKFVESFNKLSNVTFPVMILNDLSSGVRYSLDCYEDMEYTLELIEADNFNKLDIAGDDTLSLLEDLSKNYIDKKSFYRQGTMSIYNGYEVVLVHGVFLGNKIKKRISKFMNGLENISSLKIYDLSIDKTE